MSLGGGHALRMAETDHCIAAVIALVPVADGLALALAPAPPNVVIRMTGRALRELVTRRPAMVEVAGAPGSLAALVAPEAHPGFTRLTTGHGWRNEITSSGLYGVAHYRPVRHASKILAPALLQLGERDAIVSLAAIEKTRNGHREARYGATRSTTSTASGRNISTSSQATTSIFYATTSSNPRRSHHRKPPEAQNPVVSALAPSLRAEQPRSECWRRSQPSPKTGRRARFASASGSHPRG